MGGRLFWGLFLLRVALWPFGAAKLSAGWAMESFLCFYQKAPLPSRQPSSSLDWTVGLCWGGPILPFSVFGQPKESLDQLLVTSRHRLSPICDKKAPVTVKGSRRMLVPLV